MGIDGSDLLKRLLVTFQGEAEDHLRALGSLLLSLEQEQDAEAQKRLLESLSRRMHTLKGAAHAVNLIDVAELCQVLETLFTDVKKREMELSPPLLNRLQREVQGLERGIFPPAESPVPAPPAAAATPAAPEPAPAPVSPPEPAAKGRGRRNGGLPRRGRSPRPGRPRRPRRSPSRERRSSRHEARRRKRCGSRYRFWNGSCCSRRSWSRQSSW